MGQLLEVSFTVKLNVSIRLHFQRSGLAVVASFNRKSETVPDIWALEEALTTHKHNEALGTGGSRGFHL